MLERLELQNRCVNALEIDDFTAAEKGDRTEEAWTARDGPSGAANKLTTMLT